MDDPALRRFWNRTEIQAWEKTWDRSNQGGRPPIAKPGTAPPP